MTDRVQEARDNYDRVMVIVEHEKMRGVYREDGIMARRADERWREVRDALLDAERAKVAAQAEQLRVCALVQDWSTFDDTIAAMKEGR